MTIQWTDFFAERTKHITGSQIRQYFALTERPDVISFAGGFPGNEFFPQEDIACELAKLVNEDTQQALQYNPTEGNYELRALLADKMSSFGAHCEAENIMVTDGSQQGLDLLSRILVDEDQPVLVEEPAYIGGMSAIKSYGGVPVGISMDKDGPIPAIMEQTIKRLLSEGKHPGVFYTVPNFQNPTGITTTLKRRREILALACRYNLVIIEDNPYGDLCYEGSVPSCYKSLDCQGRVIYLGSYSKVLIPGIRIGWMAGSKTLIEKAAMAKQTANLCSSSLGQQLAYRLSKDGYVKRHIEKLTSLYRRKRDAMIGSMQKYFPAGISFTKPKGGFFVWVDFPDYYPQGEELLKMALEHNVAFVHGEGFSSNGGGKHSARFSFSQPSEENIVSGIKKLGAVFTEIEASMPQKTARAKAI